jgi:hypothetical protein
MVTDKPFEAEARRTLSAILGGRVVDRDIPGARRVRDFDLVDASDTPVHAVEVTSVQHAGVRATRRALDQLREADVGLTESWAISVHEEINVRPLRQRAAVLLNTLTQLGIGRFSVCM